MSFKTGLCSISFRNLTPAEIIENMKTAGLDLVEWGSDVHAPKDNIALLKEIANLQKENEIICSSYGTYFKLGTDDLKELPQYINAAKILGTSILRLWCGNKNSEDYSKTEIKSLFSECKEAAKIAKENDVILCMECHNKTFTNKSKAAYALMQHVNSSCFRMYWQPNQFLTENENIESAKLLAPFTVNIHVFNWKENKKFPLLEGTDIWKKYLKEFSGNQTLLLEFMPDGKAESLVPESNTLKEMLK